MKYHILFLFICTCFHTQSQKSEFPHCNNTYYAKSKLVATSICFDKDDRWGEAKAFDHKGKEIYKRQLRKIGGHASVQFKYHVTGMVKEAYYSSAPDAGIQWYHETTLFNDQGEVIDEHKESHEDLLSPGLTAPIKPKITTHEKKITPDKTKVDSLKPNECAIVYNNEIWIKNKTSYLIVAEVIPIKEGAFANKLEIKKGETKKLTTYGNAYSEQLPEDYFKLKAYIPSNKATGTKLRIKSLYFTNKIKSKNSSRYNYEVR